MVLLQECCHMVLNTREPYLAEISLFFWLAYKKLCWLPSVTLNVSHLKEVVTNVLSVTYF